MLLVLLAAGGWWFLGHIQRPDPAFVASVLRPAFPFTPGTTHPRVAVDAAHHNFQQLDGRYAPLRQAAARRRLPGRRDIARPSRRRRLKGVDVLIVANAMGAALPVLPAARHTAFTEAEMNALREWVRGGGALLLVADHEPIGDANRALAAKFAVDMRSARTVDFVRFDSTSGSPAWIVFERSHQEIGDHPITRGRDSTERIDKVIAFAGQSLGVPPDGTALLVLGDSAFDRMPTGTSSRRRGGRWRSRCPSVRGGSW